MTDKPTQTTEPTKPSIGNYIALGYLNILIFYLFCYPFVKQLANYLGYRFFRNAQGEIQDYKILIGLCILYAIYSIIITVFDHIAEKSSSLNSFWELFVNTYILFLPPVTFLFCILYFNKAWGFKFIDYIREPEVLFIASVYVSLFLIPSIIFSIKIQVFVDRTKHKKKGIDETDTDDRQSWFDWFSNIYRRCIIGEVLYRFLYLIIPATLLFLISQAIEHGIFEFCILLSDLIHYYLLILFFYSIFSILMRRLYTWMGKNVC